METLPPRLYQYMAKFFDEDTQFRMRRVCRRFRRLCGITKIRHYMPAEMLVNFAAVRSISFIGRINIYVIPPNIVSATIAARQIIAAHPLKYLAAHGTRNLEHAGIDSLKLVGCQDLYIDQVRRLEIDNSRNITIAEGLQKLISNWPCFPPVSTVSLQIFGDYYIIDHLVNLRKLVVCGKLTYIPPVRELKFIGAAECDIEDIPDTVEILHLTGAHGDISHLINLRILWSATPHLLILPPQKIELFK